MMKVVDQVYPEFAGQVTLVDVDVYDEANGPLMEKLGLRYIPTVVVFDKEGKTAQNVGVMKAGRVSDLPAPACPGGLTWTGTSPSSSTSRPWR